jgi:hypothetical protein
MSKVLLDTDILSEVLKGKSAVLAARAGKYPAQQGCFTTSAITVGKTAGLSGQRNDWDLGQGRQHVVPTKHENRPTARILGEAASRDLTVEPCRFGAERALNWLPLVGAHAANSVSGRPNLGR